MSRKMLINASEPEEIRVSVVEGSILEEFYVERQSVNTCLGNIYKGRVTNIEPSIGAAFIEFGGPRHGFLHVSDVMEGSVFDRCAAGEDHPDTADEDDADDDSGGEFHGDPGAPGAPGGGGGPPAMIGAPPNGGRLPGGGALPNRVTPSIGGAGGAFGGAPSGVAGSSAWPLGGGG